MRVFDDASKSIGNTPLVRLNKLNEGSKATILAKVEGRNPAYSVKCRIGAAMIWDAEERGVLKIPAWLHFGNLYDRHLGLCHWFYNKKPNYLQFIIIRIGEDNNNSIPLGKTIIRGQHFKSLLLVDILLDSPKEIMTAAKKTAELGFTYKKNDKIS